MQWHPLFITSLFVFLPPLGTHSSSPFLPPLRSFLYIPSPPPPGCLAVSEEGICAEILKGEFNLSSEPWPLVSPSVKDLIRQMLEPDASKRIKVNEILGERAIEGVSE